MTTKTIRLYAKEFKTKDNRPFLSYSAKLGDTWYKIKFRRECENYPRTAGAYHLELNPSECSFQKAKEFNDIIWIKSIISLTKIECDYTESTRKIEEVFSSIDEYDDLVFSSIDEYDDLPF